MFLSIIKYYFIVRVRVKLTGKLTAGEILCNKYCRLVVGHYTVGALGELATIFRTKYFS